MAPSVDSGAGGTRYQYLVNLKLLHFIFLSGNVQDFIPAPRVMRQFIHRVSWNPKTMNSISNITYLENQVLSSHQTFTKQNWNFKLVNRSKMIIFALVRGRYQRHPMPYLLDILPNLEFLWVSSSI